jgi:HlyD family secretion protein
MKRIKRQPVWWILVALFACAIGSYFYFAGGKESAAENSKEIVVEAVRGDIRFTVSGTSQLEPMDMQIISAPSDGTIKAIYLTRNKPVKEGDLLLEISSPTLENSLQRAQVALNQQQKEYNDLLNQLNALETKAPISGRLTYANNIDVGSNVNKTTKIATISDMKTLTITLPFALEDAVQLKPGDGVDLSIDGFMLTKTGTVKSIAKEPRPDMKGGKLIDVTVEVANDGTMDAGMKAKGSVLLNGRVVESRDVATLQYSNVVTVLANVQGSIEALHYKTGDVVEKGAVICSIQNDTLKGDVLDKEASVEQQKITVDDLLDRLEALKVRAPFDGVFSTDFVNKKANILNNFTVGSKVTTNTQFGAVASLQTMQLPIQVDELDLPHISAGMKAEVRVDSIPGKVFDAEVSQVSTVGNTTNGVTFFDVVLAVKNTSDLKYGMTATGEILIQDKKDVLLLPNEALQRSKGKWYVILKNPDGTLDPEHEVKVGINNQTHVEIVDGLKEGDKVVIPLTQKQQKLSPQEIEKLRQEFQGGNAQNGIQQGEGQQGGGQQGARQQLRDLLGGGQPNEGRQGEGQQGGGQQGVRQQLRDLLGGGQQGGGQQGGGQQGAGQQLRGQQGGGQQGGNAQNRAQQPGSQRGGGQQGGGGNNSGGN